jgi:hypothetical protein
MDRVACGSAAVTERPGRIAQGHRRFRGRSCSKQYNERSSTVLNTTQYPSDVIALVVLWRLRYRLTLRDLAEMSSPVASCSATKRSATGRRSSHRRWPMNSANACTARVVTATAVGTWMRRT